MMQGWEAPGPLLVLEVGKGASLRLLSGLKLGCRIRALVKGGGCWLPCSPGGNQ